MENNSKQSFFIRFGIHTLVVVLGTALVVGVCYFLLPQLHSASFGGTHAELSRATGEASSTPQVAAPTGPAHVAPPATIRAIYMSECVVGTPSIRQGLVDMISKDGLNAVVIDVKDFSGGIAFPTDDPVLAPYVSKKCGAADMQEFVASLHQKGIYVIGRITTFQDPLFTKAHPEVAVKTKEGGIWKNYDGLSFADVGAQPFWIYIAELARVSYTDVGFDELNFDYVRFPSDGPVSDADYVYDRGTPKAQALEEFFRYLHQQLVPADPAQPRPMLSADLFGLVCSHTDDLGIGQVLERALPYFDYIDPMVYPSHYPKGFSGYTDVNAHPYDIVYAQMQAAVARAVATSTKEVSFAYLPTASTTPQLYAKPAYPASKIRPWLQSFDWPVPYTPAMVELQIKATHDAGLDSYIFWDAANKYTSLYEALRK